MRSTKSYTELLVRAAMYGIILWRRAGRFVRGLNFRADMQIRPYHFHKFNGASGYVWMMTVLFQQPHSPKVEKKA